jgi:hypothetical protein
VEGRECGRGGRAGRLGEVQFLHQSLDDEVKQVLRGLEAVRMEVGILLDQFPLDFCRTRDSKLAPPDRLHHT